MDKLTKLAQDHGEIFESLAFFNTAMSANVMDTGKTPEAYVRDLSNFLNQFVIKHFEFEENEIFPIVLSMGKVEEEGLVRTLQHEHIDILAKIDQIKDLISEAGFPLTLDKIQVDELANLSREIVDMMMKHARLEDEKLFPILKDKGLSV